MRTRKSPRNQDRLYRYLAPPITGGAPPQEDEVKALLLEACIQARAALPDAWAAVKCNVPEEVIELLNEAIAKAGGPAPGFEIVKR